MTYRAGIVGTGGVAGMGIFGNDDTEDIGKEPVDASHAGGYEGAEEIELVAVADIDPDALARFGEAWDVPEAGRYEDHEAMLAEADLDVVSICTPSMLHAEHVADAAEIGDADVIWAEKPLACSVGGAEAAVAACEDAGVDLVVNHSRRFMRQNRAVREAVADGLIGEIQSVHVAASMELLRVGTHMVDQAIAMLDERPATIAGHLTGENESAEHLADRRVDDAGGGGFFVTDEGTFVTFDGVASREDAVSRCRLVGTEGVLQQDDRGWTYFEETAEGREERPAPTGDHQDGHEQSFVNAVRHAVDLIEGDAENVSPGWQACHTVEALLGFAIADETGGRVSVPYDEPLKDVTLSSW